MVFFSRLLLPILEHCTQEHNGLRPEGTRTLLPTFAEQVNLRRCFEPHRCEPDVHSFLGACAGIVEELQKCDIATAERTGPIDCGEQVFDIGARPGMLRILPGLAYRE
jgi:hypothetical protein